MRKRKQIIISLISFVSILFGNVVFAEAEKASEQLIISNILNTFLDVFSWCAYAVALGILIFIGIKYVLSGANERANLKGMLPKYLIGVALIVMCFEISKMVADIAGNDPAEEIIDVAVNAGETIKPSGTPSGSETTSPAGDETPKTYRRKNYKNGNIVVHYPGDVAPTYTDKPGSDPVIEAPIMVNGERFSYMNIKRTKRDTGEVSTFNHTSSIFDAKGADHWLFDDWSEYTYEIVFIYGDDDSMLQGGKGGSF